MSKVYQVAKVLELRDLLRDVLAPFVGKAPAGDEFVRFVRSAHEVLPGEPDYELVEESLRCSAGVRQTAESIRQTAWLLAGNAGELRRGRAVRPYTPRPWPEWVPAQIVDYRPERRGPKMGGLFTLRVLAGPPCGLAAQAWWSEKFVRFVANDKFGFGVRAGRDSPVKYPYSDPSELISMRVAVMVEPQLSTPEAPGFSQMKWNPASVAWNLGILKARFRVDKGYVCPRRLPATFPCHACPAGFSDCPSACHKATRTTGECKSCKRNRTLANEYAEGTCVRCYRAQLARGGP